MSGTKRRKGEALTKTRILVDKGVEVRTLLILEVRTDAAEQRRLPQLQPRPQTPFSVGRRAAKRKDEETSDGGMR